MAALVFQYGIYGLALFTLGVALAGRLAGMHEPEGKGALWSLAVFALLHGGYEWVLLANLLAPGHLPAPLLLSLGALSFAPLLYFALLGFGWRLEHVHRLSALLGVGWLFAAVQSGGDALVLETTMRWLIAAPIAGLAAAAMLQGAPLRRIATGNPIAHWALALAIAVYASSQFFTTPGDFFPASLFNTDNFQALFGLSVVWVRAACAFVAMVAVLNLLNTLNESLIASLYRQAAQSEAQFRAALAVDPECVKILDGEGNILDMNAAGLAIIGASALEEVKGANVLTMIRPEHHEAYRRSLTAALAGEPSTVQFEIVGLDGVRRWMRQHAAPVRAGGGEDVQSIVAVTHDVTAHVTMEELLRTSKASPEAGFDANASMISFLQRMSHEFRTPLNAIVGYSELMIEAAKDEGRASDAQDLGRIIDAAEDLQRLINGLLDLSRIEAARTLTGPAADARRKNAA